MSLVSRVPREPGMTAELAGMTAELAFVVAERPGAAAAPTRGVLPLRFARQIAAEVPTKRACLFPTQLYHRQLVTLLMSGDRSRILPVGRFAGGDLEPRQGDDARRFDDLPLLGHCFALARSHREAVRTHREAAGTDRDPLDAVFRRGFRTAVNSRFTARREDAPRQSSLRDRLCTGKIDGAGEGGQIAGADDSPWAGMIGQPALGGGVLARVRQDQQHLRVAVQLVTGSPPLVE